MYMSSWMCGSLGDAYRTVVITYDEYTVAKRAIEEYIGKGNFLGTELSRAGHDSDFDARLAIYSNWANRPKLEL